MSSALRITRIVLATALVLAVIGSVVLAQGASQVAASAVFRDTLTSDNIRSDGGGAYVDGTVAGSCLPCWVITKKGFFFLRSTGGMCLSGREIVLDFRNWVGSMPSPCGVDDALGQLGELNICGANSLPDVRIIANTLFHNNALSAGTTVTLPFNLVPNFSSGQAFDLEFEQPVAVMPGASGDSRVLEAGASALAELYMRRPKGPRVSLGRYHMPFQLTATKLP